jgi:hypothetical protein
VQRQAASTSQQEFGDSADVRHTFGLRETFLYTQFREGNIKGFLIPTKPGKRGNRMWDFNSIRRFIACHEAPRFPVSPIAHRPKKHHAAAPANTAVQPS